MSIQRGGAFIEMNHIPHHERKHTRTRMMYPPLPSVVWVCDTAHSLGSFPLQTLSPIQPQRMNLELSMNREVS